MKRIAAVLLVTLVQACSDAPSKSDLERALKAAHSACPNLAVENVKLINGLKVDERAHQVEFTADIRVVPLPESRIREDERLQAIIDAEYQVIQDAKLALRAQINEMNDEIDAIRIRIRSEMKASGLSSGNTEYWRKYGDLEEQYGAKALAARRSEIDRELMEPVFPKTRRLDLRKEWGPEVCQYLSGVDWIGRPQRFDEAIRNGHVKSYHRTVLMIKTDNGWMAGE